VGGHTSVERSGDLVAASPGRHDQGGSGGLARACGDGVVRAPAPRSCGRDAPRCRDGCGSAAIDAAHRAPFSFFRTERACSASPSSERRPAAVAKRLGAEDRVQRTGVLQDAETSLDVTHTGRSVTQESLERGLR
jgi:hypothetical protein